VLTKKTWSKKNTNINENMEFFFNDQNRALTGLVHEETPEALTALENGLQAGASHFVAKIHSQTFQLRKKGAQ